MTEEEFQRDIEQPFMRAHDAFMGTLALGVAAVAVGAAIANKQGTIEERYAAACEQFARIHDAYGVEPPWHALPAEISQHRQQGAEA